MDVREKLVELLRDVQYLGGLEEKIADHLISNDVTVGDKQGSTADNLSANGVTVQEWIPVTERLPDETGRYLAVKKRIAPDKLGGNRTDIVILRFFVDNGFKMPTHIPDWINEEINDEVTHWMPLPEPLEEGTV